MGAALLCAVAAGAQVIDRVLAIVDGRLVTLSDVRAAATLRLVETPADGGVDASLDRWIERVLVLQEVDRFSPPDPPPAAVDERLTSILAVLGDPAGRRPKLEALGVDEGWVRQWVRDDLRIQAYTEQRFAGSLEPTTDELENFYREHAAELERDGRAAGTDAARVFARERLMASRRRALVSDWLEGLKRRATIVRPAAAAPPGPGN